MESFSLLEKWYSAHCDGDWEHQYGLSLETLDNPGWKLEIDLSGTEAEHRTLAPVKVTRTESDWIRYWIDNKKFHAAMGARNLTEAIQTFFTWLEGAE